MVLHGFVWRSSTNKVLRQNNLRIRLKNINKTKSGLGPIWAHMGPYVFLKKVTFRVQTAPFDKITTEFWRSRRRLYIPDLLKAKKLRRQIIIFLGGSVFIKSVTFRVQTAPFDKITIDFWRSRKRLHVSDLKARNSKVRSTFLRDLVFSSKCDLSGPDGSV